MRSVVKKVALYIYSFKKIVVFVRIIIVVFFVVFELEPGLKWSGEGGLL